MKYTKKIEKMVPGLQFYRGKVKVFGHKIGLRAMFKFERPASLTETEIDKNFISGFGDCDFPGRTQFVTHMFNISQPYELMKAILKQENNEIIQRSLSFKTCTFSATVSVDKVTGTQLLETMRSHIGLLYALNLETLNLKHVSEHSHRPSTLQRSPIFIHNNALEFKMFPNLFTLSQLIDRANILAKMYESAVSGESAKDFIDKFFKKREFETLIYCTEKQDAEYKNLSLKFAKCLLDKKNVFNIGDAGLLHYFYDTCTEGERIQKITTNN